MHDSHRTGVTGSASSSHCLLRNRYRAPGGCSNCVSKRSPYTKVRTACKAPAVRMLCCTGKQRLNVIALQQVLTAFFKLTCVQPGVRRFALLQPHDAVLPIHRLQ